MGTRADFYVGRGKKAEWIGSIAWDGYPEGNPKVLLNCKNEKAFRKATAKILKKENGTTPDMGWPWPWEDSSITDYSYAFDEGKVWGTRYGLGWWPANDESKSDPNAPKLDWPQMDTSRMAPPESNRSGLMGIQKPIAFHRMPKNPFLKK